MSLYKFVKRVTNKLFGFVPHKLDPYFSRAIKIINKNNYDAILLENEFYYVEPLKKYCNAKVVLHTHNDFDSVMYHKPEKLVKYSDMAISVSDFVKNTIEKSEECNFPVVTVKNVIDTKRFERTEEKMHEAKKIRQSLGFSDDDTVCVFVGRLIPEKGIDKLVDAISLVKNKKVKLLIVGGTSFADSKRTEFEDLLHKKADSLDDRVVFTGFVYYAGIPLYYFASDIAVSPSQCEEAAPLVILEAQSNGICTIAARSGGMPEYVCEDSCIIVDKGEGFTERLASVIEELSVDTDRREKMAGCGISFAGKFDKDGYFDAIVEAITATLQL